MENQYKAIVIGGGPAGSSAAYYIARTGHKTLVLDKEPLSGSLGITGRVRNFPGIIEDISGAELVERIQKQAQRVGAEYKRNAVKELKLTDKIKEVETGDGSKYTANVVILASGTKKDRPLIPGEKEFIGKGVCYDAYYNAPDYKNQPVAVIGKTEEAAIEAIFISRFVDKIHFIIPSNKLDTSDLIIKSLSENEKIELFYSTSVKNFSGTDSLNAIVLYVRGKEQELPVKAAFVYNSSTNSPSDFILDGTELSENGIVKIADDMSTSLPGVYACGDIICGENQQAIISAAQGVIAGINAERFLRKEEEQKVGT
ncbi:NAD(P)/FAD-dependent oxidoreductase [bacterium]|nr:NAD(P)/FAD-dependent oxidoreductase [bacterium]